MSGNNYLDIAFPFAIMGNSTKRMNCRREDFVTNWEQIVGVGDLFPVWREEKVQWGIKAKDKD